ncbi:ABC transporter permease [Thalassotalea sp. SU-HH00458]|uniref:ABC transporter permease n=1 Tax=Thalassotalea sp. SU-HH00458 TaxID=3127657 RepID=UPI00310BB798
MFKNYLVTAWRNMLKNRMFSAINIFGLSIGLMSCILIMLFVREEMGFDQWIKDSDRIVRLHTAYKMGDQPDFLTVRSAGRMMEAIRDYAQNEVEAGVRFIQFGTTIQQNGEGFSEQGTMVDGSFFDVFDLPFVHGDKASSFSKPMDLVITEEMAIKYFGKTAVVGETLTFCCLSGGPSTVPIAGVIKDLPNATHLNMNFIIRLNPALFVNDTGTLHTWTSVNVYTYFKLTENTSIDKLQERVVYWLNNESPFVEMYKDRMSGLNNTMKVSNFVELRLMALTQLHLHAKKHAGNMGDLTPMGDAKMINTFIIVTGLVLLIACINFMNLSTAKASKRAREVAMRKVLGASRFQVAVQFLSEAIAIALIALIFALVAVELVLPFYNQIIGKELSFHLLNDPLMLGSLLAVTALVGLGAGLYPALYLSRFLPGHILKSSKSAESGNSAKFRTVLVVFQFATSIILVISTIVVYGQTLYSNNVDVGYQSDNKLILNIRPARDNLSSLKQELLNLPQVSSVVFSSEAPTQDNENNTDFKLLENQGSQTANEQRFINYHNMGFGFFEAYQVKPIAGRLFNEAYGSDSFKAISENSLNDHQVNKASAILNLSAAKNLGFDKAEDAIGKTLISGQRQLTIIGVIPDLHFRSIKFGIRSTVYTLNPRRFNVASISFNSSNPGKVMEDITQIWKRNVPMQPIEMEFLSEMMAAQYQAEKTTAQLFLAFSVLAILVACLGLFGLSAFTVERRTKEIGIRKVMGANASQIVTLLIWQFSKPVVIGNLIAWPIAAFVMLDWLEAFPYRLESWWLIPLCFVVGVISMLIAWFTVGSNAINVARKNPIKSLRYE